QGKNRAETDVIYGHRHGHGPGNEEIAKISVPARPESLKIVRRVVESATASCGFGKDTVQDVVLSVDEACQNVIRHAYGGINGEKDKNEMIINISSGEQVLIIGIRDFAPRINPDKVHPRDLDDVRPGGLGTHFINEIMDKVEFKVPNDGHRDNKGNLLVLTKSLK
ncbi:MAG: ATP-binding protein, partial [Rhodospirillaceae bacterium]|nr:ATP-binding protein [Rhodospirillaceae bacterium]